MSDNIARSGYFPWLGGCLVIGGIVHIASVLAMPRLAPGDAFARIAALAPANTFARLPKVAPGTEIMPFNDPAMASGACRFDISDAPLRVSIAVNGDSLMAISFHDRYGRVFYSMTDRAAVRGQIEAVIVTATQKDVLEADDNEEGPGPDLRLLTSQKQGFVLVRALAEQPGDYGAAADLLNNVRCALENG